MTGLLRRCSLGLAMFLSFTAGEVQARGIYPHGTPLLLLAVAALLAGVNVAANTLTRAERRQLRDRNGFLARQNRALLDRIGQHPERTTTGRTTP